MAKGETLGGRINWPVGLDIYTIIYGMDEYQGPTFSTGKSTQYFVVTYVGKESEKEWIYVYV